MKARWKDCSGRLKKYRRANIIIAVMLLVLALGVVGFNLTEEKVQKAQKTSSQDIKAENKGYDSIETNPLRLEEYPEVTDVVKSYYARLAENSDFVESYDNVQVYTKLGKYKDSYVAFVKYDMKIKDIYTGVPGLGTLYVEKNKESGKYHVSQSVEDKELKNSVREVAGQDDVKKLLDETSAQYQSAVESDALLREALADLKNAYEDSTGTSSNE
ncbi:hypothetical protein LIZ64_03940 [[Clostridium] hylemonae]|uniref:hypothetical protein n=1 Tax=[Clostridium] hylemonae TaxID=89153 RepID=UPI001D092286|nr:hypothetical protein [[Clostridium] hylemonae]MCB7520882.1 hypothetical protein [[Clostridium] hylemonae]